MGYQGETRCELSWSSWIHNKLPMDGVLMAVGLLYQIYQFLDWNYCGLAKAFYILSKGRKKLSWNLSAGLAPKIIPEVK
jgi:hypothetical protein